MPITGRKRKNDGAQRNGSALVDCVSTIGVKKSRKKNVLQNSDSEITTVSSQANRPSQSDTCCSSEDEANNIEQFTGYASRTKQRENRRSLQEKLRRTLFVGNLPASITKKDLKRMFRQALKSDGIEKDCRVESIRLRGVVSSTGGSGKIGKKRAVLQKEFSSGVSPTILAYVVLTSPVGVQAALKVNGRWLESETTGEEVNFDQQPTPAPSQGRFIRVDLAVSVASRRSAESTVFVGNLPFTVQEDDLRRAMSNFGQISNVRLIRDKVTGAVKGIGFIEFADLSSASLAIRSSGTVSVQGRSIRIEEWKPAKAEGIKVKSPKLLSSLAKSKPAKRKPANALRKTLPKIDQKGIFKGITVPSNLRGPQRERYLQKRLLKKKKRQIRRQSTSEPQRTNAVSNKAE